MQARSRCSPTASDSPEPFPSDLPSPIAERTYCATDSVSLSPSGGRVLPSKQQRHLAEPAQEAATPLNLRGRNGEPQVGVAPDQRLQGDLPLDPGQRRSQTDVDPLTE